MRSTSRLDGKSDAWIKSNASCIANQPIAFMVDDSVYFSTNTVASLISEYRVKDYALSQVANTLGLSVISTTDELCREIERLRAVDKGLVAWVMGKLREWTS